MDKKEREKKRDQHFVFFFFSFCLIIDGVLKLEAPESVTVALMDEK